MLRRNVYLCLSEQLSHAYVVNAQNLADSSEQSALKGQECRRWLFDLALVDEWMDLKCFFRAL